MASEAIPVKKSEETASYDALEGSCSCGRNQYAIYLSNLGSNQATLVFDTSLTSRQTHSSPLPTFLRIPLHSLQSSTHAFYDDETHAEIRKVFTPRHAPRTKRHFCGFCGTELSFWEEDEEDRDVEQWVLINLGTLGNDAVEVLEERGVLAEPERAVPGDKVLPLTRSNQATGQPWFEELIRDTGIGRIREASGGQISSDGRSRFEWRVVEFDGEMIGDANDDEDMPDDFDTKSLPSKRKVDEMAG